MPKICKIITLLK